MVKDLLLFTLNHSPLYVLHQFLFVTRAELENGHVTTLSVQQPLDKSGQGRRKPIPGGSARIVAKSLDLRAPL